MNEREIDSPLMTNAEAMAWIETIPARLSRRVFIALAIAVSGCECGRKG